MSACLHCGQPRLPAFDYCSAECARVHAFISKLGLQSYYRFRPAASARPAPAGDGSPERFRDLEVAAGFQFEGRYHCLLDGLHCPACAWLTERALQQQLQEVQVNYATQRLWFRCAPHQLAEVLRTVEQLGYRAVPYDPSRQERPRVAADRMLLRRFGVAACAAGNVMLTALALYSGADDDLVYRPLFQRVSLLLTVPVVAFSAVPFWRGAGNALRARTLTTDVSIALGLGVTFLYSLVATDLGLRHVYFDTVAMFVFVLLGARLLEGAARSRAGGAVERLLSLHARSARRWTGERFEEVGSDQLKIGDRVEVLPGGRVPADGEVTAGCSFVDEAHLTGESQPRPVRLGDRVYGGSLALDGRLELVLKQTGGGSLLAQVERLTESSQCTPAPLQKLADRVARWLLPAVLGLSLATALWGWLQGWPLATLVDRSVAILIITCPCALGIATPLTVSLASGVAASRGVLFRDGTALETARQITHVMLDKTGTLTLGELCLKEAEFEQPGPWLLWAASLENCCHHPLARAFRRACPDALLPVHDVQQVAGEGATGRIEGCAVRLGRAAFVGRAELDAGVVGTSVWLEVDGCVVARFSFGDALRPESPEVLSWLRSRGLQLLLASGDRRAVVASVAASLGFADHEWRAECLPADKVRWLDELQAGGARVAFVGDGLNDAPALRKANLGLSVANGAELSWEVADAVLLRPGLRPLVTALELADLAWTRLRGNLAIALIYNLLAIPAAALGFVSPLAAAVAMPLSSLLVVGQTLLILRAP